MNIFQDLVEELKEENLLEETVIELHNEKIKLDNLSQKQSVSISETQNFAPLRLTSYSTVLGAATIAALHFYNDFFPVHHIQNHEPNRDKGECSRKRSVVLILKPNTDQIFLHPLL